MTTTVQDVADYLNDRIGQNPDQSSQRDVYRAIEAAYREVGDAFQWSYLYQQGRVATQAPYSTGTVGYTASTRELTLAVGTWPSWAAGGVVVISGVGYRVASRTSNSVVVLDSTLSPSANISSGASYSLFADSYALPSDFRAASDFQRNGFLPDLRYVEPSKWLLDMQANLTTGQPVCYTVMGNPQSPGRLCVRFSPAPADAYVYDFIYQRRPRRLSLRAETSGTAAVTNASAAVTGTSTAFTAAMVGAIFRLSANSTTLPSDFAGKNPAVLESRIISYSSSTSVTLADAASTSYSGSKYIISDPIDLEDGAMLNAFFRCCDKHLAIARRQPDMQAAVKEYQTAIVLAREADSRSFAGRAAGDGYVPPTMPQYTGDVS